MYAVHIWHNQEPYQSIKHILLSKKLAQSLVDFYDDKCILISEISWIDYEFITDFDKLIEELNYLSLKNSDLTNEIIDIISLVVEAKKGNNIILFDPFEKTPY